MKFKRSIIANPLSSHLKSGVHLVQILVGPRQVGKTTAVEQLLKTWPSSHLYVTADEISPPNSNFIEKSWEKARALKGSIPLLVIDEIQKIPNWSNIVKLYHDQDVRAKRKLRVVLLGSSALLLQKGMNESLAGRFELIRCPHWSFAECHAAFNWDLNQFLFFGGYPGGAPLINDFSRWKNYIQNSLLETVIGRDIPTLQKVERPALLRQIFTLSCQHPAEIISLQKLIGSLQDKGSLHTVSNYLDLLSASFLVRPIRRWSEKPIRSRLSKPKLIVQNTALINALKPVGLKEAFENHSFVGRLVENAVGAALVNQSEDVYYWNDRSNEVDFVTQKGSKLVAIEVKSGRVKSEKSLKIFKSRYPSIEVVRVGSQDADISLKEFFLKGI